MATCQLGAEPADARAVVTASEPSELSVTVYRDPNRGVGDAMNRHWPRGFAMITESRDVTLPPGESTIRFEGVAEGMIAVSAIVTGLPGGAIEKNRNASLLSPASLVDGTLGNRVTITRTNPATGKAVSEPAIVSSRADGGLVLQTASGFEAVHCSGLPEKLTFDKIPSGLSAKPVFTIDTQDTDGGTFRVTLTYLAWGFDWQAHYVAALDDPAAGPDKSDQHSLSLMSWLTVLNDNGQSFSDATLLAVAGSLNIVSDLQALAEPPQGQPLSLSCYPIGSTAYGTPFGPALAPPPAPVMLGAMSDEITVTAMRAQEKSLATPAALQAVEEQLGDLKLYRVPERMTLAAKGMKQFAFLQRDNVRGDFLYRFACAPSDTLEDAPIPMEILLRTLNDKAHGLGVALPMGGISLFEPSSRGALLVGEEYLRDYAEGQEIELGLGVSSQVFANCVPQERTGKSAKARIMRAKLANANNQPVRVRMVLGATSQWDRPSGLGDVTVKDGAYIAETIVPANGTRRLRWKIRPVSH